MSTAATDRAWVATRKGLVELRLRGTRWQIERLSFSGEPVSAVLPPDSQGRMLAALNLGHFGVKLHASDDGGGSWREVATPAYPPQPEGDAGKGPAWKLLQVWTMARGGDGTVWAGTLPGGLFRSTDVGSSWQLVEPLWQQPARLEWFGGGYDAPGIHSVCPHPRNDDELLVGVSCGGAWVTRDGGDSWTVQTQGMVADFMPPERAADPNIQDPHRIVRCAAAPDVLWCQHHNGIWRSSDAAASWQRLHPSLSAFGFAVAAHPQDPLTAWFVPGVKDERRIPVNAALAVTRTRDGGQTFEELREGLPQQHCYDLVYRHGLDIAADGRRLLMGSTTGNLWSSGDGGDSWAQVSGHLPPVYDLRFG
ncbi:MAG: exo-alpha-sialidase [Rubrivivax sp.]